MANPFDKFDPPAANPFDRFDEKPGPTITSRARAAVAGVNKGFFSDLVGLPVDTAANLIDLGKAAAGTAYQAISGKTAPDALLPYDRTKVPLSSEWIAQRIRDAGMGAAIDNPNPDDTASRILHMGGRGAGASVVPNPRAAVALQQNLVNMAKGGAGGMLAGGVGETNPEWAGVAGMAPQMIAALAQRGVKGAFRGDEQGRLAMQERLRTLSEGGIDQPSVGLATGNRTAQGLENMLSQTPGSIGIYEAARSRNIAGMKAKADALRDAASPEYGPLVAGKAIQESINGPFLQRFKETQGKLYDAIDEMIPAATQAQVKNIADTLQRLTAGIQGAPNIGDRFINGRISDINDALRVDSGLIQRTGSRSISNVTPGEIGTPGFSVTRTIDPFNSYPGEGTKPNNPAPNAYGVSKPIEERSGPLRTVTNTYPGTKGKPDITVTREINPYVSVAGEGAWRPSNNPSLPYSAVSKLRTQVGGELDGNMLMSDVPRSQWKQLYAGLSEDIRGAANASGPQAIQAWQRANDYTKRGISRMDELQPLANRDTPESAYTAVANSLKSGPTVYNRLRGALTPEARGQVVATVVDELGMASPGQQGVNGDTWSPRTFLTGYNKMDTNARAELFKRIPGGAGMKENLEKIAKTADLVDGSSKIWSNPSGTAPALVARGTIGTIAAGAGAGLFYTPLLAPAATAAGGLLAANQVSKRLLLNPKFVDWLAKAPVMKTPVEQQAYLQRLIAGANKTNDPEFQQDIGNYINSIYPQ